jgi:hypothetical protein
MKENVKQNARRTQKRQHTIDFQTGVRFVETRIVSMTESKANKQIFGNYTPIGNPIIHPSQRMGVKWRSELSPGNPVPALQFNKKNLLTASRWKSLYLSFVDFQIFVKDKIHAGMKKSVSGGKSTVQWFTEFSIKDFKLHANPLWKNCAWHDWVFVKTEMKDNLPCHLMCFLELFEELEGVDCLTGGKVVPGIYALVQYVPEDPFLGDVQKPRPRTKTIYTNTDLDSNYYVHSSSNLLRWSCKETLNIGNRKDPPYTPEKPMLALVSVKKFKQPCVAVPDPNQPRFPHAWIFVLSKNLWADQFIRYAKEDLVNEDMPEDRACCGDGKNSTASTDAEFTTVDDNVSDRGKKRRR